MKVFAGLMGASLVVASVSFGDCGECQGSSQTKQREMTEFEVWHQEATQIARTAPLLRALDRKGADRTRRAVTDGAMLAGMALAHAIPALQPCGAMARYRNGSSSLTHAVFTLLWTTGAGAMIGHVFSHGANMLLDQYGVGGKSEEGRSECGCSSSVQEDGGEGV